MTNSDNKFITGSLGAVFAKTAAPIILMMLVSGSFALVDAYYLGVFVGAEALTAVTSMFPLFMLVVALSTLVSNGFASVMARLLGAKRFSEARSTFAEAITLSLLVCAVLITIFFFAGQSMALAANNGSQDLARLSALYMAIVIYGSPLMFMLTINSDSLRSEGHVGFMALMSIGSVLFNLIANYLLIAKLNMGVAGAAYGTLMAQGLSLTAIAMFRWARPQTLSLPVFQLTTQRQHWREFLALGAPSSLNYIGISLASAAILFNLQLHSTSDYATTVSAYGILTRVMTFVFLPLLGLSMAFQSITGNNVGAKLFKRTNRSINIALVLALIYCIAFQALFWLLRDSLGSWFVNDDLVVAEVSRILPVMTLSLFLIGPLMIISIFFQSIGDSVRAGILGISKTYCFTLPLLFLLPPLFGEWGIWYAGPTSEVLALGLTALVLFQRSRQKPYLLGLYYRNNIK